jgi:hypothetical protein
VRVHAHGLGNLVRPIAEAFALDLRPNDYATVPNTNPHLAPSRVSEGAERLPRRFIKGASELGGLVLAHRKRAARPIHGLTHGAPHIKVTAPNDRSRAGSKRYGSAAESLAPSEHILGAAGAVTIIPLLRAHTLVVD